MVRYQSFGCAYVLLMRGADSEREILLHIRKNTGYMDGKYDASASGHLEPGETLEECAIRETLEEIGIILQPQDLKFALLYHEPEANYIKAIFTAELPNNQTPKVCEPDKSGDLRWFRLDELPNNVIPFLPKIMQCIKQGIDYADSGATISGIQAACIYK